MRIRISSHSPGAPCAPRNETGTGRAAQERVISAYCDHCRDGQAKGQYCCCPHISITDNSNTSRALGYITGTRISRHTGNR
jgi:hypothetical protein